MLKRLVCLLLVICFLFSLCACGCEHQWSDPTCTEPAKCIHCGEVSGDALGHDFAPATCVDPETCTRCGTTGEEAFGHSFSSGYCTDCGSEDPEYVDFNRFGFKNMYGMNSWLSIEYYNYSKGFVVSDISYNDIYTFYSNYYETGGMSRKKTKEDIVKNSYESIMDSPYFETWSQRACSYVNDTMTKSNGETFTIIDRVVDTYDDRVVIKSLYYNGRPYWFVPCDMLDFSKIEIYDYEGKETFKIPFKS
ncbi:MAG: hypothetical protein IJM97_05880 [Clostridia bacterium]|nr:hypothetical protein [Clostridia bacterium]